MGCNGRVVLGAYFQIGFGADFGSFSLLNGLQFIMFGPDFTVPLLWDKKVSHYRFSLAKPEVPEPPPTSAPANPDEIIDMDSPPAESPAEPGN